MVEEAEGALGRVRAAEEQVEKLERMLREADRRATSIGKIVGRVSRFGEVKVGEVSRVEFTIDPVTYYGEREAPFHKVGDYLVIVDPKDLRMVLVRVVEINRRDELAAMGVQPPVSPIVDGVEPRGLITNTTVQGELVLEMGPEDRSPRPAVKSIEPQAPVVIPSPEALRALLDLPERGVVLGALATPGGLVAGGGIPVRLPLRAFLHHVLIVGTTGVGKTTLLKNMIASAYSQLDRDERFVALIMDLNEDFVQLPMPPDEQPQPEEIRQGVYGDARPPKGIVVALPVTAQYLSEVKVEGRWDLHEVLKQAVMEYVRQVVGALSPEPPTIRARSRVFSEGLNVVEMTVEVPLESQGGRGRHAFGLSVVPYALDSTRSSNDSLVSLMPGLTELARNTLNAIRKRFMRDHGVYPPLEVIQAALLTALLKAKRARRAKALRAQRARGPEEEPDLDEDDVLMELAWDLIEDHVINVYQYLEQYLPRAQAKGPRAQSRELAEAHVLDKALPGSSVSLLSAIREIRDSLLDFMPHLSTLEALYRRLSLLLDTGFIDILYVDDKGLHVVPEPPWPDVVSYAESLDVPVIMDLRWGIERSYGGPEAFRVIAYRMLDRLLAWKQEAWSRRQRTPNVVVFIDEAHQFFPSEGRSREEAEEVSQVSAMISKVARLGRSRGLGLVFSTHMPKDLNSLIVQLTNTKVLLRSEESQLEAISLPGQLRGLLPRLQERHMAVLSFVLREGYVMAVTTTPLTKHFDISARA